MKLDKLESPKRTARVAAYATAIQAARARGVTWLQIVQEIGSSVGIEPGALGAADSMRSAFKAALRQIERGRLKPAPPAPVGNTARPSPPPLPGQKPAEDRLSELDKIRAQFDK